MWLFLFCAPSIGKILVVQHGAHETRCTMTVFVPAQPEVQPGGSNTHINAVGTGSSSWTRGTRRALGSGWTSLKLNTVSSLLKPLHCCALTVASAFYVNFHKPSQIYTIYYKMLLNVFDNNQIIFWLSKNIFKKKLNT